MTYTPPDIFLAKTAFATTMRTGVETKIMRYDHIYDYIIVNFHSNLRKQMLGSSPIWRERLDSLELQNGGFGESPQSSLAEGLQAEVLKIS
jgi:hypothetical protein